MPLAWGSLFWSCSSVDAPQFELEVFPWSSKLIYIVTYGHLARGFFHWPLIIQLEVLFARAVAQLMPSILSLRCSLRAQSSSMLWPSAEVLFFFSRGSSVDAPKFEIEVFPWSSKLIYIVTFRPLTPSSFYCTPSMQLEVLLSMLVFPFKHAARCDLQVCSPRFI